MLERLEQGFPVILAYPLVYVCRHQVSDGAAATLLMTRATAAQLNLRPLGVFRSYAVVGVPPEVMGIGPALAIPVAVSRAGLEVTDVDIFELNEAFASQATYCIKVSG